MEDAKIVELYLLRSENAIRQTSEKYGPRLRALAWGIVKDRQTAEECENDTYLQAWNSIPPHTPREYLYAYLARITRHIALDHCRDRARLKRSAYVCALGTELEQCLPAPGSTPYDPEEAALRQALNDFLHTLKEEQRHIFVRRYWYLDSVAQIARRFGISQSKVKTTLYRCRNQLKAHLEQEGYAL